MPSAMPIEIRDERGITVPVPADEIDTEQFGKFLVSAGQDGYSLKSAVLITREVGTQRDPARETLGVKITVSK